MPRPGKRWRHFIINTKGTWLHGDPRGFRDRDHRIHSSGDYKHPPPPGEHANLHKYMKERSDGEVTIPYELRPIIGRAVVAFFLEEKHPLLALAVGKVHTHGLVELPYGLREVKLIVGHAKRKSSRAVKDALAGSVWSAGLTPTPVDTRQHLQEAHDYIIYEQGPTAWTWSFRDGSLEGKFNRKRKRPHPKRRNPGRR